MHTLIADDDAISRLLLGAVLRKLGHIVEEARDGREAWNAWLTGKYPLIISDWMMPDLDGLEFCRRIRSQAHRDYTYIVLLTSRSGKTNYLEAGSGSPVVLIHGSGPGVTAYANWRLVLPVLAGRFRVLAPDMAGLGFS